MPTLALLDGHSIAYRAFFALPEDLATTSGQVTNAVFGFTRMLVKLLGEHHPDAVAVAWDVGRETFRTAEYSEYKANRSKTPDAFASQLPLIREVLEALGIPQTQAPGFEADDVIASLSRRAVDQGWDVLIVTGDRDSFQLVDDHRRVLYTRRGISDTVIADAGYIEERYGIPPSSYVEYAALRGDTSDNLPGVPGVGEKTAAKLISSYGSLEGVYEHLEEQTPKLRENLAAGRHQVFLNRNLMRLVADLEVAVDMQAPQWDRDATRTLFTSLEFHSMWDDLVAALGVEPAPVGEPIDVSARVATAADVTLGEDPPVVEQAEGGGEDWVAFLEDAEHALVVPLDEVAAGLLAGRAVVTHDAKRLLRKLEDLGGGSTTPAFDTALAAYVLDPATRSYDLGSLAEGVLGLELESPDREPSGGGDQGMFDFSDGVDAEAAGRRVVAISRLAEALTARLEDHDATRLYQTIELPLIPVLVRMERWGIAVDRPYLEGLGDELRSELAALETAIHEAAGEPFNINSSDQLATILFGRLELPVIKKTSTGKPSTDASVLEKLDHPLVTDLLRYRELEKLRSTYVDGYLPLVADDGRIHTTFNQMAAATGRLSSEAPNLQNIPVRSESGLTIRRAFVAEPGFTFVVADYSQIELRVLAHMSGDPGLVEAFEQGLDVHTATAARVFEVTPDLVTSEMRRRAKVINFGLLYGMEAYGLADRLGISRDEARTQIDAYFSGFPKVKEWLEAMVGQARRDGYTATLFGRRRYLPELKSDNFRVRQMGERMALNAPIQGTAADIIKKAMIDLDERIEAGAIDARLLLQIHDELIVEAPEEAAESVAAAVAGVMEGVVDLRVPLVADVARGGDLAAVKH